MAGKCTGFKENGSVTSGIGQTQWQYQLYQQCLQLHAMQIHFPDI